MNKKIPIFIFVVLLFSIMLSGCEEGDILYQVPSPSDKLSVTVKASANVERLNKSMQQYIPVQNKTLNFVITKTSGQTFTFKVETDQNGYAECPEVGYNLYENQLINVYYSMEGLTDKKSLTFDSIYDDSIEDQTYTWSPHGLLRG